MLKIGAFGGTFDPPHLGHMILAAEALEQLHLDRLLWVLTPSPPHKLGLAISNVNQRLALVKAAIADEPHFELSTIEIDRPAPHYTVETMRLLKRQFSGAQIGYVMGGDSLRDLPDVWREPQRLVHMCDFLAVMRRPADAIDLQALEAQIPGITAKLQWVDAPLLEISASEIRKRIASGRQYRYFLPPAVYQLIERQAYYR